MRAGRGTKNFYALGCRVCENPDMGVRIYTRKHRNSVAIRENELPMRNGDRLHLQCETGGDLTMMIASHPLKIYAKKDGVVEEVYALAGMPLHEAAISKIHIRTGHSSKSVLKNIIRMSGSRAETAAPDRMLSGSNCAEMRPEIGASRAQSNVALYPGRSLFLDISCIGGKTRRSFPFLGLIGSFPRFWSARN